VDQPGVRLGWLAQWLCETPLNQATFYLEELLAAGEGFSDQASAAIATLVAWVSGGLNPARLHQLAQVAGESHQFHLSRLLAHAAQCPLELQMDGNSATHVPDYGRERPLTLGERKSLARRPARHDIDRLLRDPHPAVTEQLLLNPLLTENDVLKMVTKRSINTASICHIARSNRWIVAPRVRSGLLNNPKTPLWQSIPLVWLCTRPELSALVRANNLPHALREAAGARLARRPPVRPRETDRTLH
jgi:hypothetical protein